jgi:hypothetical protein
MTATPHKHDESHAGSDASQKKPVPAWSPAVLQKLHTSAAETTAKTRLFAMSRP